MVVVIALTGLVGCGGGTASIEGPTGGSSPEQAVEVFLTAAREGLEARRAGEFTAADRAYEQMASVFGTEAGSISRAYSSAEVRNRMIVLSSCLRPDAFQVISPTDSEAWRSGRTTVTVELNRRSERLTLPFVTVLGRGDRWFIEQIDFTTSFSC